MSDSRGGNGEGLRAIAFAAEDGASWGAAFPAADGWSLVIGPVDGPWAPSAGLRLTEEAGGAWRLEHGDASGEDAVALLATPAEPPASEHGDDGGIAEQGGEDDAPRRTPPEARFVPGEGPELCRLHGTVRGRSVDWRGVRMELPAPRSARDRPGSARLVAGWLADGSAFGLIAARPRRADRADLDAVSATLFDPEGWLAVSEPRLSTTYGASELPSRVNLELWVGEGEHEYPRRAAGEAAGAPAAADGAAAGGSVQVIPLRCHSRGEEGFGVYVLASL